MKTVRVKDLNRKLKEKGFAILRQFSDRRKNVQRHKIMIVTLSMPGTMFEHVLPLRTADIEQIMSIVHAMIPSAISLPTHPKDKLLSKQVFCIYVVWTTPHPTEERTQQ